MNQQQTAAQNYLNAKKDILNQAIALTRQLSEVFGDIPKTHQLLSERKQYLNQLEQIDRQYAPALAGYCFAPEDLEAVAALAEEMWNLDDEITEMMRRNKDTFRQQFRNGQ